MKRTNHGLPTSLHGEKICHNDSIRSHPLIWRPCWPHANSGSSALRVPFQVGRQILRPASFGHTKRGWNTCKWVGCCATSRRQPRQWSSSHTTSRFSFGSNAHTSMVSMLVNFWWLRACSATTRPYRSGLFIATAPLTGCPVATNDGTSLEPSSSAVRFVGQLSRMGDIFQGHGGVV